MKNNQLNIEIDQKTGCIHSILICDDKDSMDWCGNTRQWGSIYSARRDDEYNPCVKFSLKNQEIQEQKMKCVYENDRFEITVIRYFKENGHFSECYTFKNIASHDIFIQKGEIGIYTPFCDSYIKAENSLRKRCNAHIWCGENTAWINALRQGESDQNMGLILTDGSIDCYSIDRLHSKLKTAQRGNIILHPEATELLPGESFMIGWELFTHKGNEDFFQVLSTYDNSINVSAEHYTVFENETIKLKIPFAVRPHNLNVLVNGEKIPWEIKNNIVYVEYQPNKTGEHKFFVFANGFKTHISIFVAKSLEKIIEKRVNFIVENQQYHRIGSSLDGAYLIYDNKEKRMYFDDITRDHNACRERLGMGILIARYLQTNKNEKTYNSLMQYINFILRNIVDLKSGKVYDSLSKSQSSVRLYNAPWMITFLTEVYLLTKEEKYIKILIKCMEYYYEFGGYNFYPNGFAMIRTYRALSENPEISKRVLSFFKKHVGNMIKTGLNYPGMEVIYEQTIVTAPADFICELGIITKNKAWVKSVEKHIKTLERFGGMQPDYRLNGIPIRYWDDYWFGKSMLFADTFPHYWSCLSARVWKNYYTFSGIQKYKIMAENTIRNCMCLFQENGTASCAYIYPFSIDGKKGQFFDEWANDQDFALYFAMEIFDM